MASDYSLVDVLERFYQNLLALEAAVMELTQRAEGQDATDIGENVRAALGIITQNADYINQGLARLKHRSVD